MAWSRVGSSAASRCVNSSGLLTKCLVPLRRWSLPPHAASHPGNAKTGISRPMPCLIDFSGCLLATQATESRARQPNAVRTQDEGKQWATSARCRMHPSSHGPSHRAGNLLAATIPNTLIPAATHTVEA